METVMCSICLEGKENAKWGVIMCGHVFHTKCIKKWANIKELLLCPVCNLIDIYEVIQPLKLSFTEKVLLPVFEYQHSKDSQNRCEIEQNRYDLIRYANTIKETNKYLKRVRTLQRQRIQQMNELKTNLKAKSKLE